MSASLTFRFQLVWGLRAGGQHTINFSHLEGVSVPAKELKDVFVCNPGGGTRTLPQGCTIVSFDCSSPVSASLPFPNEQLFEPAAWNSGKVMEAE